MNNIITDLKAKLPNTTILREYPLTNPKFPCIIISEGDLSVDLPSMDSGGYHYNNFEVVLEIYTTGTSKINQSDKIRINVNDLLGVEYGLQRVFSDSIPNMVDLNVYRYKMAYVGKLDKNKTIYRR
ncbi:MAG TPA: hypothetical protein VFC79_13100 [Tissierellaceae bacterium]|nr:hypothetical protein [Tissierellaceae bacterium]